jgi:predicted alpha/beta hydrolase
MAYWLVLLVAAIYTVRLGWSTWKKRNRLGAFSLWLLALGILTGSYWVDYGR